MKIAILGPAYPFRGGIAQFSGVLAKSLEKAGHTVHVVNFRKQFPKIIFPGKTQFDDSPQALKLESERVFVAWNPLSWIRTARTMKRHDPDLILVAWWMPFFAPGYWAVAKLLGKRYRSRIAYLMHNVVPHEKRFGDMFLSKLALGTATFYVCLSQSERDEFYRLFPAVPKKHIAFSPHPIYDCYAKFAGTKAEARKQLGLEAERLLLFFGLVRDYKGLDTLIEAMPEILKDHPGTKLAVTGEFYQSRETYDAQIRKLGIGNAVVVRDNYVSGDEIGVYFAAADCVVLPYRSATQSGIIQMAYALDTPVITTNVGGLGEVVKDGVTGFVVPPEEPRAVAEAVNKFFVAGGRSAFEENVKREARRFSWEALVETIEGMRDEG